MTKPLNKMTTQELRIARDGIVYRMEYSVHRRHDAPELYAADMKRFNEIEDELAGRI